MPFYGLPPQVTPYLGYRNQNRLLIEARALRNPPSRWNHTRRLSKMRALLGHFASKEQARMPVTLVTRSPTGTQTRHESVSDDDGFIRFDIALGEGAESGWPMPPTTRWETVELHWTNRDGPQCVQGLVLAPGADNRLAVISDIDDTIIETGITGGLRSLLRNWDRLLAQMPAERAQVPGSVELYTTLSGGNGAPVDEGAGQTLPAAQRPFFYVSSSPWNLFSYLVTFMKTRALPVGPIHLRNWGFDRATLGSSGHGAHKASAVKGLLAFYPTTRFALIGDDTQGDLIAFSKIAEQYPDRIAGILIRMAGEVHSAEERAAQERVARAGVPLWTGETYAVGADFLGRLGLSDDGDAAQIVAAVEQKRA